MGLLNMLGLAGLGSAVLDMNSYNHYAYASMADWQKCGWCSYRLNWRLGQRDG